MVQCTTIIPTIGRDTLARTVESALAQELDPETYEIIVINNSGKPLPAADWQRSPRVQIVTTNQAGRAIGSNVGAALARGKYLHFLHDDDFLYPGAIKALLEATEKGDYVWIYGGLQRLDNDGNYLSDDVPDIEGNVLATLLAGDCVHLCVSLIRRDVFMAIGGFDPSIKTCDDWAIEWQLALRGDFGRTPHLVAGIRVGAVGSTNDWTLAKAEKRSIRERAMGTRGVFQRAASSMTDDHFAHGRLARAYIFSAGLNMLGRHPIIAMSRLVDAGRIARHRLLAPDFYSGLRFDLRRTDPQTRRAYQELKPV